MNLQNANSVKTALCLGHPGHEIKVLAWVNQARPLVSILTDGSGPDRPSRLDSTRAVLEDAGCTFSSVFGLWRDREIYAQMREGPAAFVDVAVRLLAEWQAAGVELVVGDSLEGFNTTHDVCRMIINAAVEKSARQGWPMSNYEFPLEGLAVPAPRTTNLVVDLDEAALASKREIVNSAYPEMATEVDRLIKTHGDAAFRQEVMCLAAPGAAGLEWSEAEPPFYERYGMKQIAKGHYEDLITYREHLQPIATQLWAWACA